MGRMCVIVLESGAATRDHRHVFGLNMRTIILFSPLHYKPKTWFFLPGKTFWSAVQQAVRGTSSTKITIRKDNLSIPISGFERC